MSDTVLNNADLVLVIPLKYQSEGIQILGVYLLIHETSFSTTGALADTFAKFQAQILLLTFVRAYGPGCLYWQRDFGMKISDCELTSTKLGILFHRKCRSNPKANCKLPRTAFILQRNQGIWLKSISESKWIEESILYIKFILMGTI